MSPKANADGQGIRTPNFGLFSAVRFRVPMLWSVLLVAVVFHVTASGTVWAQSMSDEYHVKAAFLFHFAQLVEWPTDTSGDGGNGLFLCTLGDDPFHGELENTIQGKQVGSRRIRIRHVNLLQATRGCNMLFVSKSEGKRLPVLLANFRNLPVLTVGEADDFLNSGGMIRFTLEGNKVRFEINRKATESAKLRVSSQLLLLAKNVIGGK